MPSGNFELDVLWCWVTNVWLQVGGIYQLAGAYACIGIESFRPETSSNSDDPVVATKEVIRLTIPPALGCGNSI